MAQTRPGSGLLAERMLKQRMDAGQLPRMGLFNPKVKVQREWSRGRVSEGTNLYLPGYIFIRFDCEADDWRPINWTPGVSGIMYAYGEVPAAIQDEMLAPLLGLCTADGEGDYYLNEVQADAALFKVGREIKVLSGTWQGWQGPITRVQGQRLRVIMTLFGRATQVDLPKKFCEVVG